MKRWILFPLLFVVASIVLACAFEVGTMRVTFDQINPRAEQVARTLGWQR